MKFFLLISSLAIVLFTAFTIVSASNTTTTTTTASSNTTTTTTPSSNTTSTSAISTTTGAPSTETSTTKVPATTTALGSTTTTTPPPITTIPIATIPNDELISFKLELSSKAPSSNSDIATQITKAVNRTNCGVSNIKIRTLISTEHDDDDDGERIINVTFIGIDSTSWSHVFLYDILQNSEKKKQLNVESFSVAMTMPIPTAIPLHDGIVFKLKFNKDVSADEVARLIASLLVNDGCTINDIHVDVYADSAPRNATVNFIGSKKAEFSHLLLYNVLEVNGGSKIGIEEWTASPISNGDNNDKKGPDVTKIAIAASAVGVVVIIVLVCGLKKRGKFCSTSEEGENKKFNTGAEMSYSQGNLHDDLEEYRKIR